MGPTSYVVAATSDLTTAGAFFLGFALSLGGIVYLFLTRPWGRHPSLGSWTVRPAVAGTVAAVVAGGLFSVLYVSAIAGFNSIAVGNGTVRVEYPVLGRPVSIRVAEIATVERPFAHKQRWRVVIQTKDGATFESAPGAPTPVRLAAEAIERELAIAATAAQRD